MRLLFFFNLQAVTIHGGSVVFSLIVHPVMVRRLAITTSEGMPKAMMMLS